MELSFDSELSPLTPISLDLHLRFFRLSIEDADLCQLIQHPMLKFPYAATTSGTIRVTTPGRAI